MSISYRILHNPGTATGQAFSFPAIGESFEGEFGMDLDYMNFDLEQVLPSIGFSEVELGIFYALPERQL